MKIAILTLRLHTNYGGILQAYALQKILRREGHDVDTLQRNTIYSHGYLVMPLIYLYRLLKKCIGKYDKPIFLERKILENDKIISVNTNAFIERNINIRKIESLNEVKRNDYDAIVVGSDQIWRKAYFCYDWNTQISDAFLNFTKKWNLKRISYAASFGIDDIEKEYSIKDLKKCITNIKLFDALSVREISGVKICKNSLGADATHVLDPTMLLDKNEYIDLVNIANIPKSDGNLFCYILDPNDFKTMIINRVKERQGLSPFFFGIKYNEIGKKQQVTAQPQVESWLRGFMDANLIITDSFHACVFSYIFKKPFIVIGNETRGITRIESLLKLFHLEDNLLLESENISDDRLLYLVNKPIDEYNADFETLKVQSITFLKNIGK